MNPASPPTLLYSPEPVTVPIAWLDTMLPLLLPEPPLNPTNPPTDWLSPKPVTTVVAELETMLPVLPWRPLCPTSPPTAPPPELVTEPVELLEAMLP